jgi:hypothetical protein
MKEGKDLQKFVDDLAAEVATEVKEEVEEAAKKAVREVETVVVEEVLTWVQYLKTMLPTWCCRPRQTENPSLAKPEETSSTRSD